MSKLIDHIWALSGLGGQDRQDAIDLPDIQQWMSDRDIEVQGILWNLLGRESFRQRIAPPLTFDEINSFFINYYRRCLLENPNGEWSDSRYSAGWALASWFKGLWADNKLSRQYVVDIKNALADFYRKGDEDIRLCIINATLEHLFENKAIARFFKDWTADLVLKVAYEKAALWVKGSGSSPL